jgi:hypothetical protein
MAYFGELPMWALEEQVSVVVEQSGLSIAITFWLVDGIIQFLCTKSPQLCL